MIIVTGTKRSGTSMWMQILDAAGLPEIGTAFPKAWGETLREANPRGFYESPLRRGIFYATNPHPVTGAYLPPEAVRQVAVKVFIPGLCRTDQAFISRVVGTVRHWREYAASIERLRRMEDEAAEEHNDHDFGPRPRLDAVLEWWLENYALIRNLVTRRYPAHLVTYDRIVDAPGEELPEILEWLGADEIEAGVDAVSPETRTQRRERIDRSHAYEGIFDELYELVHAGEELTGEFVEKLNETHEALIPEIEEDRRRVMQGRRERRREMMEANRQESDEPAEAPAEEERDDDQERRKYPNPLNPDALENLVHADAADEPSSDQEAADGEDDSTDSGDQYV